MKIKIPLTVCAILLIGIGANAYAESNGRHGEQSSPSEATVSAEAPTYTPSPTASPTPEPLPTSTPKAESTQVTKLQASTTPPPSASTEYSCEKSTREAAEAGWRILSCDPLRVEPINKPEVENATPADSDKYEKSNYGDAFKRDDPHYRWNEQYQCYDESNFPGRFEDSMGEEKDGYYPYWLSAVKNDNGCTFYFHPTQGRENAPIPEGEGRG
jgi:hypothetical protein